MSALLLLAVLGATGCEVSVGTSDDETSAIEQIHETGRIRWDLRDGLTREQVGLSDDRRRLTISPASGDDTIDAEVVLSGDVTLAYDVDAVFVEGTAEGRPAAPSFLNLSRTFPSIEEAGSELERAVRSVGIDPGEVRRWQASMQRQRAADDPSAFLPVVFAAPDAGGVSIEVEAATTLPDGRVTVSYLLNL